MFGCHEALGTRFGASVGIMYRRSDFGVASLLGMLRLGKDIGTEPTSISMPWSTQLKIPLLPRDRRRNLVEPCHT
jgi:hypothetical protein